MHFDIMTICSQTKITISQPKVRMTTSRINILKYYKPVDLGSSIGKATSHSDNGSTKGWSIFLD